MKTLLLALALAFAVDAGGQSFVWARFGPVNYLMNPSYPDFPVELDEISGHVYSAHLLQHTLIYGSDLMGEHLLECRDLNGNILWDMTIGGSATVNRIKADDAGNVYVTGMYMDTLHIGTQGALPNTGIGLNTNGFIFKLDGNGNLLWSRNLTLTWQDIPYVSAMDIDPSGNCWYAWTNFIEGKIVQLDASGNDVSMHSVISMKTVGNISFDPWGGLYVSGATDMGIFVMDSDTFWVNDQYNMFAARFKPDGSPHWAEFAHDITFQRPVVVADASGNAYVTGTICDTSSFGNVILHNPPAFCDFFAVKTDSTGNFQWALQQPPLLIGPFGAFEYGTNLHADVDAADNFYFSGVHRGTVDWGNGFISSTSSFTDRKIAVVKVNPSGFVQWVKMGGSNDINYAHALSVSSQGDCYLTGFAGDTAVFDTINIQTTNDRNFILAKLSGVASGISDPEPDSNPGCWSDGYGMLIHSETWSGAYAEIFDLSGRRILSFKAPANGQTDISALQKGVYLVRMQKGGSTGVWKVVR
jgi:hypothetical protein